MRITSNTPPSGSPRSCPQGSVRGFRGLRCECWFVSLLMAFATFAPQAQDPQPVFVEPDYREYGWVEFGGAVIADTDGRLRHQSFDNQGPASSDVRVSFSPGFAVSGGFGERFTPSFMAEIQGGLIFHNLDEVRISQTGWWSPDADLMQVPILVNLLFEAPLRSRLKPFLGAGAGASISWLNIDDRLPSPGDAPDRRVAHSSTEINFAYQGFAGVRLQLARQGVLAVTYRAVATGSPQWTLKERETRQSLGTLKLDNVLAHCVTVGFLVRF